MRAFVASVSITVPVQIAFPNESRPSRLYRFTRIRHEVDDHRRGESDEDTGCGDYDGMLCRSRPHLVFWAVRLCRSARYSTATLQANFDALEPGESITLDSGTYPHSGAIQIRVPGVRINGNAPGVTITGLSSCP